MAITTVPLSSVGQTHYGTAPNNVGAFVGTFAYNNISATQGVLTITGRAITFNDTNMDLITTAPAAFDCANAVTGYGNATMGLAISSTATPTQPVVTWDCPGVNPAGPKGALRPQAQGTIVISVSGTGLGAITASSFQGALSSGTHAAWFPVHFRWLNDNDLQTNTTIGDDYVASS